LIGLTNEFVLPTPLVVVQMAEVSAAPSEGQGGIFSTKNIIIICGAAAAILVLLFTLLLLLVLTLVCVFRRRRRCDRDKKSRDIERQKQAQEERSKPSNVSNRTAHCYRL